MLLLVEVSRPVQGQCQERLILHINTSFFHYSTVLERHERIKGDLNASTGMTPCIQNAFPKPQYIGCWPKMSDLLYLQAISAKKKTTIIKGNINCKYLKNLDEKT